MPNLAPSPAEHRIKIRDGLALRILDWAGDDVPCVLVHGLASNARLWDGCAAALAARGHRVISVDQRGHGRSDKPNDGYDFETVVGDLVLLFEALELDRPVVAGQSWGGNVVIELAWRHPDIVRGVCAIDGGMIELGHRFSTWEECAERMRPPALIGTKATRMEASMRMAHPDWPQEGIGGAMANFEIREDGTVAPWLTLDRHMQIVRALFDHRPSTLYADIDAPVLWVPADSGDAAWTSDKRASIEVAEALLARSRTHWFSPADHDLHAQHPERLADVLHGSITDGFFV